MVIYTRDFTAACNLRTSPHLQPTSCLLLLLHLLSIFLFAPSAPFALSFQLVLRRQQRGSKFSQSAHQLAITPEKLANESTADEREKWDKLLFINTQRGVCVCVPKRGFKQAKKCFIYTSDKHPNTSIPWAAD